MMASSIPGGEEHFVDKYRAELIQLITMVHPVLDNLIQEGLLTQEHYDTVKAKETTQEKMRGLYKFSRGWSFPDKDMFYQALKASNPGVMEHLEGTSFSANLKMTHDNRLSDIEKEYRVSLKERFQRIPEYNSRMGEAVHLQKRFTKLLMRKGHQNKEEKEQEIRSSGRRLLQTMEKRHSDEYSPTTIQTLFDPDEDGFIPNIVVLQGPAGIGKTMTSKKIMLDWASGDLYQDNYDFVFYLSCREINTIPENISLEGLLSRACRLTTDDLVCILKDPGSHRKLLTIVDGFDELRWTLVQKSEGCLEISSDNHKEIILQRLLRKQVLPQSSLIITTRSLAMEKLKTLIDDPRHVEIQGFTREDREEYAHKFFGNKEDADKVLSIIKDNEVVYTMCAIPMTCWIVCTVMKQEIKKDLGLIRCNTMTSIYLLYLEVLLTHHSKKEQSVHRKQTCLKKLCALANQGVLNQQILFEKKDLERHGLSLSEVESVFLNENIFHWDVRTQTCYSFIHLSVQEFLAALYYGLDDASDFTKDTFLSGFSSHLILTVQFLFGLLNEDQVKTFSESTGINISLRARVEVKEWAMKNFSKTLYAHTIFYLYETQDEDFIRSVMSQCSSLKLSGSPFGLLQMGRNYSKQLSYCLKTLKGECYQSLYIESLTVDSECQKILSPLLYRCQEVRLYKCDLTSSCWEDLRSILITSRSLTSLDLRKIPLQNSGMKLLCGGLRHPDCTLKELRVFECKATLSCCDDLCSVITTNQTLTRLQITLDVDKKILLSEADRCCEVLRNAGFSAFRDPCWGPVRLLITYKPRRILENHPCEAISFSAGSAKRCYIL